MPTAPTHRVIQPSVMYFGTPVVLISTLNEDGSPNLAPMSSAWWIGKSCLLGLDDTSQTTFNLRRTGELVLNLVSSDLADAVDRLAGYTGTRVVPRHKADKGFSFLADKFGAAGLTAAPSDQVGPPRVQECPIQIEARVAGVWPFGRPDVGAVAVEARALRTHVRPDLVVPGSARHIDPDRWDPLIMKFTHLYGGGRNLRNSRLAELWRIPRRASVPDPAMSWSRGDHDVA